MSVIALRSVSWAFARAAIASILATAAASSCYAPRYRDCVLACARGGGCPDGMACSNGLCALGGSSCGTEPPPQAPLEPCDPDARRCGFPGEIELCDPASRAFYVAAECTEPRPACHAAECVECAPGMSRCEGETSVAVCGDDARWGAAKSCANSSPTCSAGRCSPAPFLAAGESHTCGVVDGRFFCWGDGTYGQLGSDSDGSLAKLDFDSPIRSLAAGGAHTCALFVDGGVLCWGDGTSGQLGAGIAESSNVPEAVDLGAGVPIRLTAGVRHTCALFEDGRVKCWGNNDFGQLGLGDVEARGDEMDEMGEQLLPVDLGPGGVAVQVAAGADHTCVVLSDGAVRCWGANDFGQLGVGDTRQRGDDQGEMGAALEAVAIPSSERVRELTAGGRHTCAILEDGKTTCWGRGSVGQLGTGDTLSRGDDVALPLEFIDLGTALEPLSISAGRDHTCATLRGAGSNLLKCWGNNASGELGIGSVMPVGAGGDMLGDALEPIDCGTRDGAPLVPLRVSTGDAFTCAAFDGAGIKCWGKNDVRQLGLGTEDQAIGDAPGEMGEALPFVNFD